MVSNRCKSKNAKKIVQRTLPSRQGITKIPHSKAIRRSQRLSVKMKSLTSELKKVPEAKTSAKSRRIQVKPDNAKAVVVSKAITKKKIPTATAKLKDKRSKRKPKRKFSQQENHQLTEEVKTVLTEKRKRRHKNDYLIPRKDIPTYTSNPYFTSKNAPAFISVQSFRRVLHRCIYRKDLKELAKCIKNKKQLCEDAFDWSFSYCSKISVEERAILTDDIKFIIEVMKLHVDLDEKESLREGRARPEEVLLTEAGTGRRNFYMLGHATANIEMARGGKEGNNALVKYEPNHCFEKQLDVPLLFEKEISFGTLQFLASLKRPPYSSLRDVYASNIYVAIRFGNRKLAAYLIETYSRYNFNELHIQTLKNSTQPLKKFMPISIMKKAFRNRDITPLHTAAINPNASYLKALMAVEANFNIVDLDSWYTIHYAAVCEGSDPLKFILDKGVQYSLLNKAKELPIHCAARAGRIRNVKLLLEAEKKTYEAMQSEEEDPNGLQSVVEADNEEDSVPLRKKTNSGIVKRGSTTVNAKTRDGHTPLHLAVEKNHLDVVELLLSDENINVEAQLSASHHKITPLMVACQNGFLDVANILIDKGAAVVEKVDKLKRTALTHAVINGQVHIVSMLLRRGASPTAADSSGNTPAHYAAAYGWLECLELLSKAESKVLEISNDWQLTPLAVAYMKGHLGIVKWLIDGPFSKHVDINCRDSSGCTLIFNLINHYRILSTKNLYSQMEYLLAKGTDCSLKDSYLNTPLHCFAKLKVKLQVDINEQCSEDVEVNSQRLTVNEYKRCIDLLIEHGAKLDDKNQNGESVVSLALKGYNLVAAEYVLSKYLALGKNLCNLDVRTVSETSSENLLHLLFNVPFKVYDDSEIWNTRYTPSYDQYNIIPILNMLIDADKNLCKQWLLESDKQGRTPFLLFCEQFTKVKPKTGFREDSERKKVSKFLEQLLSRTCEIIPLIVSIFPEVILQECYKEKEEAANNSTLSLLEGSITSKNKVEKISAIFYALYGNSVLEEVTCKFTIDSMEYGIKNTLLTMFIDSAIDANILQELLSIRNSDGFTPLLYTVSISDVNTSLYLMKQSLAFDPYKVHGAVVPMQYNADKQCYDPIDKTVLMYAVENKLFEVIRHLKLTVEQWNAVTVNGDTALHYAAKIVSTSTVSCFNLLKEKGVLNKANNKMQYPLHVAVEASQRKGTDVLTEPVEWLIANNGGVLEADIDGRLPLHYAFVHIGDLIMKESYTVDPICIVSVLQNAMDKVDMDHADKLGNTPLHYAALRGANVCTVTLLRCGCNPNCVNNDGNTPLAVAVIHEKEACALTLIQAKSDVVSKVYIRYPSHVADKNDKWIWIPNLKSKRESIKVTTISSLVVRNGWEGIIYIILDVIGKNIESLSELVKAALEHNKYNLVQTLLRMMTNVMNNASGDVKKRNLQFMDSLNLFLVFAQHVPPKNLSESAKKVFYQFCSLNIKWWSVDKANSKLRSAVIEHLAKRGNYELLNMIYEFDKENGRLWSQIEYDFDDTNPLLGVIEECSMERNEVAEEAKKWIEIFGKQFGINTLMPYKRPLFYGIVPWRYRKPVPDHCHMTALIKAIQSRCVPLVKFLLQSDTLSTDFNACDEHGLTPLMHACIVNSEDCIRLLFDPSCQFVNCEGREAKQIAVYDNCGTHGNFRKRKSDVEDHGIAILFGGKRPRYTPSWKNQGDVEGRNVSNENISKPPIKLRSSLNVAKTVVLNDTAIFPTANTSVNLSEPKNFLHFMIFPCGWQNTELLVALCKGTPEITNMINSSSIATSLMEAKALNQKKMVQTMAKLTKMGRMKFELPAIDESVAKTRYNVTGDSEACLAKILQKNLEENVANYDKTRLKPHKNSGYEDLGEICVMKTANDEDDALYKVLLTKTDLQYGNYGFHNYYRVELIKRKGVELYILFTNWGRIGDAVGQYQRTPFSSFADADKEFRSIFRSKTGNEFSDIKNFVEKPNKYKLLNVDSNTPRNIAELDLQLNSSRELCPDTSENRVYLFVKDISNVKRLQERTRAVSNNNRLQIPFGRLCRNDILAAHEILVKLKDIVDELDVMRKELKPVDEILALTRKQATMSNDFYRLIPLGGFETLSLPIIDSDSVIKKYEKTIEDLLEFEIAGKLVTAAYEKMPVSDPFLYIEDALECEIKLLDVSDMMTQFILQYIQNSSHSKVLDIFSIKSKQSNEQFNNNSLGVDNHIYLWHGTKPENLLSILKLGLVATPSSALQTGQIFGQGIYFADVFAKSEGYCTKSNNGVKYILLCQVALGKVKYVENEPQLRTDENKSYDTVKINGKNQPNPLYNLTLEDGITIPIGQLSQSTSKSGFECNYRPSYNEYVVADKSHVAVRYIVAFQ